MIKHYLDLTKPRLTLMNIIVAAAAYMFAWPDEVDLANLGYMSIGLFGVVAGACVLNNVADRKLDAKMERTKNRATAAGSIHPFAAIAFALALFVGGVAALMQTHILALASALAGFFIYVFLYTPLKTRTGLALYIGALAGATPPLVGYAAAAHTLDTTAYALFGVLFLWQVPHFLAIAKYRFDEYAAAGVPLLVRNPSESERKKARNIFHYSLVFLVLFCLTLIVHRWIR